MAKKIIITESMLQKLMVNEAISKADITSLANDRDFKDAVAKVIKNDRDAE